MELTRNFAVLEGGDGSGTTTQLSILKNKIKNTGKIPYFSTFEPTTGKTGELIRRALKNEITINPRTLCYLFAADRNEHLYGQDGIINHVKNGEFVICDRYVVSSLVYQGIECGDKLPESLNSFFPLPEITIFLDIKPEIAVERMKNRSSLEIYEVLEFQEKVYKKYISVLEAYGKKGRVEIVDASKSVQEVADLVWGIIGQMPIFNHNENDL